jgi:hypothetical protein
MIILISNFLLNSILKKICSVSVVHISIAWDSPIVLYNLHCWWCCMAAATAALEMAAMPGEGDAVLLAAAAPPHDGTMRWRRCMKTPLHWWFFSFFVKLQKKRPVPFSLTYPNCPLVHPSGLVRILSIGVQYKLNRNFLVLNRSNSDRLIHARP